MELNFEFEPEITEDYLLSQCTEETYMEYYSGLHVRKGLQKSQLRPDKHPTVSFFRNPSGKLIYKDFGDNTYANFVGLAMIRYNCRYKEALRRIAEDFGYVKSETRPPCAANIKVVTERFKEKEECIIQAQIKPFSDNELEWWSSFGITLDTLKKFNVFSCQYIWVNGNIRAENTDKCPIFGYYFGKKEKELWKIYFPTRDDHRFINNLDRKRLQGFKQLPENGPLLVITKSQKDIMSLYELGIPAIAPNSEHLFVEEAILNSLKKRFKYIVVFYDNDKTGLMRMASIRREHPELNYVFLPRNTKCKDISDFIKSNGQLKAKQLIKKYAMWLKSYGNRN